MNRNKQTEILGGIITVIVLILLIFLSNVEVMLGIATKSIIVSITSIPKSSINVNPLLLFILNILQIKRL